MRNLAEYPITEREIVDGLTRLAVELEKAGRLGDMRPLLLRVSAEIVQAAGRLVAEGHALPLAVGPESVARLAAAIVWDAEKQDGERHG